MDVLFLQIVYHQAAVVVIIQNADVFPVEQFLEQTAADLSQISRQDQIIVGGRSSGILEKGLERLCGRRRHGRSHIGSHR